MGRNAPYLPHVTRHESTGFALAARIVCRLTPSSAMFIRLIVVEDTNIRLFAFAPGSTKHAVSRFIKG